MDRDFTGHDAHRRPFPQAPLLGFLLAFLCGGLIEAAPSDRPPRYTLRFQRPADQVADVEVEYAAQGQLKTPGDQKIEALDMDVVARFEFQDRHLASPRVSPKEKQITSFWAARQYHQVDVTLTIGKQRLTPTLREEQRLLGITLHQGSLEYVSPNGALTREELDLIRLPADRQVLSLLLPRKPVEVGTVWKPHAAALAAFLAIDTVGDSNVKSTLKAVDGGFARVELEGIVHGALGGVATEIALKCRYYFYIDRGEFASLQLVTQERRAIGHINPGVDVTARLKMRLEPQSGAGSLSNAKLASLQQALDSPNRTLVYHSSDLGVAFNHGRDWYATAEDRRAVVLRQLFRGELVAQCNVSILQSVKKGKAITLTQFQKDIRKNLGENFGSFVQANEETNDEGYLMYRVEAVGTASTIPVRWIYYLLSDTTGRRVAMVFTMEQDQVARFGAADEDWVRSLKFTSLQAGPDKSITESEK